MKARSVIWTMWAALIGIVMIWTPAAWEQTVLAQSAPAQTIPTQTIPTQTTPAQSAPAQTVPSSSDVGFPGAPDPSTDDLFLEDGDLPAVDLPTVFVREYIFSGNTLVSDEELRGLVADLTGRELTFYDLEIATARVMIYYLAQGYPLVRALLPAQEIVDGVVRIEVVEARLDQVVLDNRSRTKDEVAWAFLAPLVPGELVTSSVFEGVLLPLLELPGVVVELEPFPGSRHGTVNLRVQITDGPRASGAIEVDTHGSEVTGRPAAGLTVHVHNPTGSGDRLTGALTALGTLGRTHRLAYAFPIGAKFRVEAGYSASEQILGGEFAPLEAGGSTRRYSLAVRYPLLRSAAVNRQIEFSTEHTTSSEQLLTSKDEKHRRRLVLGISDDATGVLHNQFRYSLQVVHGWSWTAEDESSPPYQKLRGAVSYVHPIGGSLQAAGSISAQMAFANLDSSEKMGIGGPNGVRGYPSGVRGDTGALITVELRKQFQGEPTLGMWQLSGFVDAGVVNLERFPTGAGPNTVQRRGFGVGLTWAHPSGVLLQVDRAWPMGPATDADARGQLWMRLSVAF